VPTLGYHLTENVWQEYMLRRTGRHAELVIVCALFTLPGVLVVCRCLPLLALPLVEMCMLGRGMEPFGSNIPSAAPLVLVGCLSGF